MIRDWLGILIAAQLISACKVSKDFNAAGINQMYCKVN